MNKLAKKMANREGFTLVELIVVIAILGILAGIAIPVYSGYIAKAKEANDIQQMDAIKTAVVFVKTEGMINTNDSTASISSIEVTTSAIKADGTELTENEYIEVNSLLGKGANVKTWSYTFNSAPKDTAIWNGTTWTISKAASGS